MKTGVIVVKYGIAQNLSTYARIVH